MRFTQSTVSIFTSLCIVSSVALAPASYAASEKVSSPDGRIIVSVDDDNAVPSYSVKYKNKTVLIDSKLGMKFKEAPSLGDGFKIASVNTASYNGTWEQPWGERRFVKDHHNELMVNFSKGDSKFSVKFRVFNDGIGFRYEVPVQKGMNEVEIIDELTEFNFEKVKLADAWWIEAENVGRYEQLYKETTLADVDKAHTPITMKLENGTHVSLHEAALVDYSGMSLKQQAEGVFKASLSPRTDSGLVKTKVAFNTPWRTIQIASNAVGLVNSDLILNLNEPNKLGDVSWVKPGKYVGIWWGMHIGVQSWESGEKHGATTEETKRYMDFAAKYGFDGVLVEGWNIGWDGVWWDNGEIFSFTESYPDFDIKEVAEYGEKLGVRLIGHHETSGDVINYRNQMDEAFDLYQAHGVTQVKTGYVANGGQITRKDEKGVKHREWHDGQFMVNEFLYNIEEAAKRKISINTHEPVKDTGLRRTYPNWLTREGAKGQEHNAWGDPSNPPKHTAILPYTRMLSGPMDFTPGVFDLWFKGEEHKNRVKTTLAKQLSLYVVVYSPLQMACDLPENYEKRLDAFQFIQDVPADWEKTEALAGEIGEYVVIARQERGGKDWYLGALTNEDAREFSIPLNFLESKQKYIAEIYRDGDNADWEKNPFDLVVETKKVKRKKKLKLKLAPGGGVAIRFKAL